MCVIMIVGETRPSLDMISKAWSANRDGGGIAWRERGNHGVEVHWRKGIVNLEEMEQLCLQTPLPYVAHFRVASIGGVKRELTHPFIINERATLLLSGKTKGGVLFHNGHWAEWHKYAMEAAMRGRVKVPCGSWSDTRAIAWLTSIYGKGFMDLLPDQRGVILTPHDMNIFTGFGWKEINNVWCSNDWFWSESGKPRTSNKICTVGRCTNYCMQGKDTCATCDKSNSSAPLIIAAGASNNAGSTGGATTEHPFHVKLEDGVLTPSTARILYRRNELSKNLLKKIEKDYNKMTTGSPKTAERARKELKLHTAVALSRLSSGPRA